MAKFEDAAKEIHDLFKERSLCGKSHSPNKLMRVIKKYISHANTDDAYALILFQKNYDRKFAVMPIEEIAQILEEISYRTESGAKWSISFEL